MVVLSGRMTLAGVVWVVGRNKRHRSVAIWEVSALNVSRVFTRTNPGSHEDGGRASALQDHPCLYEGFRAHSFSFG